MRILIVKIAAIGDIVMTLPLLVSLRHKYPNAKITWICGKIGQPLIEATKMVDKIIQVEEKKLLKGSFLTKIAALFFIWLKIGGRRFDLSFCIHADPRYRSISLPIFCNKRKAWGKNTHPIPGQYHLLECLALLRTKEEAQEDFQFPFLHLPNLPFKADILIAPGGAKNTLADDHQRRWPISHYANLIRLLNKHPLKVAIIGSKEDQWVLPHLKDVHFENWIGKFDLLESIACLKNCKLFITHDSGPLHLSKLADCPTIALFGPTNPMEKVSPKEKIKIFWGGDTLSCRPCYNGKKFAKCTNNICLSNISPHTIYQEVLQKLDIF
jgi:ADP-heptose:LPS heptosyltransferase